MNKNKTRYHVHGLEGYSKETYTYVGAYRWQWLAEWSAHSFVSIYPYGAAKITLSPDKPLIQ